ncbi:MAG TPA: hypothetical protein VKG25_16720 [Bryobacteraceae bacterium]|nr:hypothetical protein [Bryobacteraceae bacterium]
MADFRKWLIAFAAVALLLSLGTPANAQLTNFSCIATAGNPPLVRSEGVTELVGDVQLQCTGGTPTSVNQPIPESNFQIFLNTNVTSRIINSTTNLSEALILIDDPYTTNPVPPLGQSEPSTAGATTQQTACQAINQTNCAILGTGGGTGAAGPYKGSAGGATNFNIFQGYQVPGLTNSISWLGVPIDAPGSTATRTIRITNVRANACNLAGGTTTSLIPTLITMYIAVNGSQQVTISNPTLTVGYIQQGLTSSNKTASYTQCNSLNLSFLGLSGGVTAGSISLNAQEGFASSWKVRNWSQIQSQAAGTVITSSSGTVYQNVPGFAYNTESGFVANPSGGGSGFGLATGSVGLADTGTQLQFNFAGVGAGISLFVPTTLTFSAQTGGYGTLTPGYAVLVGGAPGGAVSISGTTASVTYEVLSSYASVLEQATLGVTVAYVSNTTNNLPGLSTAQASVNFAPLSSVPTASSSAPIPRFCQPYPLKNLFTINICSCNLLFPFVTNTNGFDTGVAIANTTLDPYGTALQQGIVTLYYYGTSTGGAAAPSPQKTTSVAAGTEVVFTLSGGGDHGVTATPGFQGYMISIANFQYCHAFAFISDMGSQKLAEGYLAIQLDIPGLNRTGVAGENEGN